MTLYFLLCAVMMTMTKAMEVVQIAHTRAVQRQVPEAVVATVNSADGAVALRLPADAWSPLLMEVMEVEMEQW